MNCNFISPQDKYIFTNLTRIWIIYIFLAVFLLISFNQLVIFQTSRSISNTKELDEFNNQEVLQVNRLNEELARLKTKISKLKSISPKNTNMSNAIKNLFNLIPDQISVTHIDLDQKELTIKGITPSKEVYKFLLENPLKAIFIQTKVEFFPLSSGWYNFVSVSKVEDSAI